MKDVRTIVSSRSKTFYDVKFFCFFAFVLSALLLNACTIVAQSPYLSQEAGMPYLAYDQPLISDTSGNLPYQKWRLPSWEDDLRYVWLVGNYDFRNFDNVEMILYFHGMHSSDYYTAFRKELQALTDKRPNKPFVFIGFVDTPHVTPEDRSRERWKAFTAGQTDYPERLSKSVNTLFRAFRKTYANVDKDKTSIVLSGFSGGGKVLDAVGQWLAKSPKDDPYAEVFRARLSKIVYFDCWFDKNVLETVPTLLEDNPDIKIVGTVHMKKPVEHAAMLAGRYNMSVDKERKELKALDGRLTIFKDESHWNAMISRLKEAL